MPSPTSPLQLPPLRPSRSISSSSSLSFCGEIWSGRRPPARALDLRKTILYWLVVKSDARSGKRSTCSSSLSRSSPRLRKLLKSGRCELSEVSLNTAERSPAVLAVEAPLRAWNSRSSKAGGRRRSRASGLLRSSSSPEPVRVSFSSSWLLPMKSGSRGDGSGSAGAGREHGARAERPLEREQHHGGQRRPEEAAQRVVLHAAAPHLRADAPDEPVEHRAGRHRTNGSRACAVLASTLSTIWPRSVSTSMPSASPSKFRITRCRSAGATSALRSSALTL